MSSLCFRPSYDSGAAGVGVCEPRHSPKKSRFALNFIGLPKAERVRADAGKADIGGHLA